MDLFSFLRGPASAPHIEVGSRGEETAARFLRRTGYTILQRNVRVGHKDEIDILAFDPADQVLVFAEVKTRARNTEYEPDLNVTAEKRFAMARAARRWIVLHDVDMGYRFDVVCVVQEKVTAHYKDINMENARSWRYDR